MSEVTLSSKNQIVVPRDTRKALGLKPGDRLLVVPRGSHAVILRRPKSFAKALRGLMKGVYPPDYLEKERGSWVELLVQPYRDGDRGRVDDCFGILARFPNLRWVAPDLDVADLAARMRARYRLKTPDAVQAATANHESVSGFLTNDPGFRRVAEMDVFLLDDVL